MIPREHLLYAEIGRKVTATEVGSSADVRYATWKAFLPRGARLCLTSEAEWIRRRVSGAFRVIAYATATIRKEMWCSFSKEITTPAHEGIQLQGWRHHIVCMRCASRRCDQKGINESKVVSMHITSIDQLPAQSADQGYVTRLPSNLPGVVGPSVKMAPASYERAVAVPANAS